MDLRSKIAAAKSAAPSTTKPKNAYALIGRWMKGDDAPKTWVGRVTGLDQDEKLALSFKDDRGGDFHTEMEWTSKKGATNPAGMKTFYLTEGLYKAHVIAKDGTETWEHFAVLDDGSREDLTEQQIAQIFLGDGSPTPEEADLP